jgi:Plasmid pRiA4b ORF-3-like protein
MPELFVQFQCCAYWFKGFKLSLASNKNNSMAKKNKGKVVQMLSPENYIRQKARTLPVFECWINSEWDESGLGNLIVARKHTNGNITLGLYLVDLKCLGVKDAAYYFNIYESEYLGILAQSRNTMELIKISYTLAHNIVYAGIEFAGEYGFKPHKDFSVSQYILEEDTEDIELIEINCGIDGKPAYIRGTLDTDAKAAQVITQLEKVAGPGNYTLIENIEDWDELEDDDQTSDTTFQFKLQLNNIKNPPVWRRIKMPADFTFYDFHEVIQLTFGWTNSHLFMFSPNGFGSSLVITDTQNNDDDGYGRRLDADSVLLSEIFKTEKQHFSYIYDFGDSWEHKITLEKIIEEPSIFPECTAGKGKCPPEDCGGIWGYERLKEILADKKHPEYKETAQWLGLRKNETWDPAEFDIVETAEILAEEFGDDVE